MAIKVLVVDDTVFYRKIISDILKEISDVEVVGTANNGKIALSRIKSLKPDLLTLDVEMPEMNGLEVLEKIQEENLDLECLMVSSLTEKGGEITVQALSLGAFDFIAKPDEETSEKNKEMLKKALSPKLKAFLRRRELKTILKGKIPPKKIETDPKEVIDYKDVLAKSKEIEARKEKSFAVAIGVSTGGPAALNILLPMLKKAGVPIFIVQHMPPVFTDSLAKALVAKCNLQVKEAKNGETAKPGIVYIAPGGMQMKVASGAGGHKIIRINDDPPENNCKPSVDYLFRSIAREYGSKATGVIMTGMGSDGKLGLKVMKASGAVSIAQNAASSVVYGMPKAVIDAGLADVVAL